MERITVNVPRASANSPLAGFAANPMSYIGPEAEDWEILLGPMIKSAFGWGVDENRAAVKGMMRRGEYGLDGFHDFMKHFVVHRGLKSELFESKVEVLIEELESVCVSFLGQVEKHCTYCTFRYPCLPSATVPIMPVEVIDVDGVSDDIVKEVPTLAVPRDALRFPCGGNRILFPAGKSHHTSYPFGLHDDQKIPWNYHSP